ncbi:hypothetical protein ABZ468_24595 [Streptomyces sp. NPDC005708]|uniref:hypothetical protein n=1 Tax=Streptomyces sp. NPDC005708 TaxID=3154564 RepID=UPI0033E72D5D
MTNSVLLKLRDLRDSLPTQSDGRLTDLCALGCLAMVPLALLAHQLLPPKYFFDSITLQSIATGQYAPLNDTSFLNVGQLYKALGLARSVSAAGAFGLVLAMLGLWASLRRARGRLTLGAVFLVAVYVGLASVYLSQFSKDVWVLPVTLVVLLAPAGWRGDLLVVVVGLLYAVFLRQYWFLVLGLWLALRLLMRWRTDRRLVLLTVVVFTVVATTVAPLMFGAPLQSERTTVNLDRSGSADAVTAIAPVSLGSGPVADSAENLVTLAQFVVPTPLAAQASPLYLGYLVLIACIWLCFGIAVLGPRDGLLCRHAHAPPDDRAIRCAMLAIAFLTTQSYFEPDYGSYLKHLSPVLPLVITAALGWTGSPLLRPSRPGPLRSGRTPSAVRPRAAGLQGGLTRRSERAASAE